MKFKFYAIICLLSVKMVHSCECIGLTGMAYTQCIMASSERENYRDEQEAHEEERHKQIMDELESQRKNRYDC